MISDLKRIIMVLFIIVLFPAISLCWYSFCQRNNDKDGMKFIVVSLIGILALPVSIFLPNVFGESELFILALKISCLMISLAQLILIEKKVLQYHVVPTWESYIK